MKKTLFLSLVSSLIFCLILSCDSPKQHPIEVALQAEVDSLLAQTELTSISVGLFKNGEVFFLHEGELSEGQQPTNQTFYEIASLTKTFTGTLLAHAIVEQKLSIDDDIRGYLPGDFSNLEFEGHPITFRHLVTHTSGIPRMFPDLPQLFDDPDFDTLPFELNRIQEGYSEAEFMEALAKVSLDTIPGDVLSYSNAGANVIGYCLEQIYKLSYEEMLQQKILKPLKMNDSRIVLDPSDLAEVAPGYNVNRIEMPIAAEKDMSAEGGIKSTLPDMMKYVEYQLRVDDPVIKTSHQELWEGRYGDFESGLFWQIFKDGDKPDKIFQNGGAFGTSSWITLIPESSMGIFLVTNLSGPQVHNHLNDAANNILSEIELLTPPNY